VTKQSSLSLLLPEWQGYGLGPDVHHGATALAAEWFGSAESLTIDAPVAEPAPLQVESGVLGLGSIAPRFVRALDSLRERAPDRLRVAGGTCGVELAPIAYLNERYRGDITVLWLDAHADLNTPESSPSGHFHGMVLRTLLGEGPSALVSQISRPLTPDQVVLVGPRDLDPPESAFVRQANIALLGDEAFESPEIVETLLTKRGVTRIYVHFDVDVLSGNSFDAALMTTPPGGPTLARASALIERLARRFELAGLSVLELCDRGDAVTRVAAALAGVPPAFPPA